MYGHGYSNRVLSPHHRDVKNLRSPTKKNNNCMASLDKQSVRQEFDRIKTNFQAHVSAGKVSRETAALFNMLLILFNLVLSIFLEKRQRKPRKTPVFRLRKLGKI